MAKNVVMGALVRDGMKDVALQVSAEMCGLVVAPGAHAERHVRVMTGTLVSCGIAELGGGVASAKFVTSEASFAATG